MYLSIQLKDDKKGWVDKDLTDAAGLTDEFKADHLHIAISEIRKELNGKITKPQDFIEGMKGQGKYRVSTNPSFIKVPGSHWLKQRFKLLLPVVQKERARRVKIAQKKGR